jgi:hypothetical protein
MPPEPGVTSVDTIPIVGPPERLTLNQGKDATPAFTPDGSGIWYAWEKLDRPDHDLCLGLLPVGGGTRTHEVCHSDSAANPDSVNWNTYPAPDPAGRRLAWQEISANPNEIADGSGGIILSAIATLDDPSRYRTLARIPYQFAPGSTRHYYNQVMSLHWANDTTIVCVGTLVAEFALAFNPPDTFYTGLELAKITITHDSAITGFIPGTDDASGLTFGPGGAIYFTRNGDERVYRTTLAGGAVDTVFDFGPAGFARDPVYVDGAIYAVVGGDVSYLNYPNFTGKLQHDGGGELWRADSAGLTRIDNVYRWRRPAVSPDGHTLVIEGRDPISGATDLYLLRIN